jgi:hypothetical protein
MRNIILFVLLFSSITTVWAQSDTVFIRHNQSEYDQPIEYTVDTVIFGGSNMRTLLYKTTLLPETRNQQYAKNYGLFIDSVAIAPCENSASRERPDYINKVNSIVSTKDSFFIQIKFWGNCCHQFLCDIEIADDSTLNIITIGYGMYCSCDCCYGLNLYFEPLHKIFEDFNKLKYITINGDERKKFIVNYK